VDRAAALAAVAGLQVVRRFRRTLPSTPSATTIARDLVRSACEASGLAQLVDAAELIITELVANVVRHVGGTMEIAVIVRERFLHISVRDRSPVRPERGLPDPDTGEGGRGLLLVDAVASGWGTSEAADGKVVWTTLRIHR
jgi:anti-sigma regulatory factor (Ser/Thr protein kinase)